jgi:hypothetical protein
MMATFIWDDKVQWPPPAHILLNYDVVAPGGVLLSSLHDRRGDRETEEESVTQPYLALITPLSGYPDQGLPPGSPPGIWGGPPLYPDQGLPGQPPRPTHPIAPGGRPPGIWGGPPTYPDQGLPGQPPGYWGGVAPPYPDQGLPGGQGGVPTHPIHIPGIPDQGLPPGEPVPPDQIVMPEPPAEYQNDLIVSVYRPGQGWTTTSYTVAPDQGQPAPTPHRR